MNQVEEKIIKSFRGNRSVSDIPQLESAFKNTSIVVKDGVLMLAISLDFFGCNTLSLRLDILRSKSFNVQDIRQKFHG